MENKDKKSIKLNIMWSAPYNHDHYINWFAIGFSRSKASEELFKKMYYAENLEGFPAKENEKFKDQMHEFGQDAGTFTRVLFNFNKE
jgi:hypothetical protein